MFRRGIQSSGRRALSSSRLAVGRCLRAKTVYSGGNRMATIRTLSVTNKVMLPSHEMVPLPALSPTMEVGTIKSWEVRNHKHLFNLISQFLIAIDRSSDFSAPLSLDLNMSYLVPPIPNRICNRTKVD